MYKNLTIFNLDGDFDDNKLINSIGAFKFKPMSLMTIDFSGWDTVFADDLYLLSGDIIELTMRKDSRIIPSASVNELLKDALNELDYKPSRKKIAEMKDEIYLSLVPKALIKTVRVKGYIDVTNNRIVINTGSIALAEEFISLLRHTIGGLSAYPFYVEKVTNEHMVFARWLQVIDSLSHEFTLLDACKLRGEHSKAISFKNVNIIDNDSVIENINQGMVVSELRMGYQDDYASFTLNDKLQLKSLQVPLIKDTDKNLSEEELLISNLLIDVDFHRSLIKALIIEIENNA